MRINFKDLFPARIEPINDDPVPPPANARVHLEALGKKPTLGWVDERKPGEVNLRATDVRRTWERVRSLETKSAVDYRKPRRVK